MSSVRRSKRSPSAPPQSEPKMSSGNWMKLTMPTHKLEIGQLVHLVGDGNQRQVTAQ